MDESNNQSVSESSSVSPSRNSGSQSEATFRQRLIIDTLRQNLLDAEKRINIISADLVDFKKNVNDTKLQYIETLGVFVAVFTFISVDFQILRTAQHPLDLIGLILISAGLLILFPLLIHYIVSASKRPDKIFKQLFITSILCIILGTLSVILRLFLVPSLLHDDTTKFDINLNTNSRFENGTKTEAKKESSIMDKPVEATTTPKQ